MMVSLLLGPVLKLNRAEQHLHAVQGIVAEFVESDFYEAEKGTDSKGRLVCRMKRVDKPPRRLQSTGSVRS